MLIRLFVTAAIFASVYSVNAIAGCDHEKTWISSSDARQSFDVNAKGFWSLVQKGDSLELHDRFSSALLGSSMNHIQFELLQYGMLVSIQSNIGLNKDKKLVGEYLNVASKNLSESIDDAIKRMDTNLTKLKSNSVVLRLTQARDSLESLGRYFSQCR